MKKFFRGVSVGVGLVGIDAATRNRKNPLTTVVMTVKAAIGGQAERAEFGTLRSGDFFLELDANAIMCAIKFR